MRRLVLRRSTATNREYGPNDIWPDDALAGLTEEKFKDLCRSQWWRLNHLYWIQDELGKKVRYRFNKVQQAIWTTMWFFNIYLKSRQHGVTTFWCLFALDTAIWKSDQTCIIIAHKLDAAEKIFRTKVKYPFDNLHPYIKSRIEIDSARQDRYIFGNGSSIEVTPSARSGTAQVLHVSEFGYTCARDPVKASEIVSGAINAVHVGGMCSIESTAMGREGKFFEYVTKAAAMGLSQKPLTKLDFKFHVHVWHDDPKNVLDPTGMVIYPWMQDYFNKLRDKYSIHLSDAQKAWYVKKYDQDPDNVKREHPSYWEEAFEAAIEGAYFATQFKKVYQQQRICSVPWENTLLVNTYWDIGMNDAMAIWFEQTVGREIHLIDYYEDSGEGIEYYWEMLKHKAGTLGYRYGRHWGPHDLKVRELGPGQARYKTAEQLGLKFDISVRCEKKIESIQAARNILGRCWFDEARTKQGVDYLEAYRKEWDKIRGQWKDQPYHNEASNAADAFQNLAMNHSTTSYVQKAPATNPSRHKAKQSAFGA